MATRAKFKSTSKDVVIAVMGPTGAGKSYFVPAATGDKSIEVGHTLQSVTQHISEHRLPIDPRVVLLDTPGFDDTYKSDGEVLREIATWLADRYIDGNQLTAILYLQRISDARIGGSAVRNLWMFSKLVGIDALKNVVLVTTMWARVDFFGSMIQEGARTMRYSGTPEGALDIIRSVLKNTKFALPLDIQQELIDKNLTLAETAAGRQVLGSISELKLQNEREIKQVRADMETAIMQKDNSFADTLAEMSREFELKLVHAQAQIEALQSRNPELEALQIQHEREMKSLRDSLEDRMRFIEEQAGPPPPAYEEPRRSPDEILPDEDISFHTFLRLPYLRMFRGHISYTWSFCVYSVIFFVRFFQKLLRPRIPPGYRRLEWTCTCGELLYGDFRETSPGALNNLVAKLQAHQSTVQQGSPVSPPSGAAGGTTIPAKAHSRRSNHPVNWNLPDPPGNSTGSANPANTLGPPQTSTREKSILQLCIETGKYTLELGELDLEGPQNYGVLFQKIRNRYEDVRHSILPLRLRFSKQSKAIFVKFRLNKRPFVSPIAGSVDMPSIPPEDEVRAGNYNYNPCPIDEPPIDYRTFFHHFWSPASKHPDALWGPRLPRKLGPNLTTMSHGWGVHLEESPDWPPFAALNFICLLVSDLVAGIYSWKTKDTATGVAIGAWLTATQTLGVTTVFFWWI